MKLNTLASIFKTRQCAAEAPYRREQTRKQFKLTLLQIATAAVALTRRGPGSRHGEGPLTLPHRDVDKRRLTPRFIGRMAVAAFGMTSVLLIQGRLLADTVTTTFTPPMKSATVTVNYRDAVKEEFITASVMVVKGWKAEKKRDEILKALRKDNLNQAFTLEPNGTDAIDVTSANGNKVTCNVFLRASEEKDQVIIAPSKVPSLLDGDHGKIDPHAPQMLLYEAPGGVPAVFTAGVKVGPTEYSVALFGDDPGFNGAKSAPGSLIASMLYQRLLALRVPDVSFSLEPGNVQGYSGDIAVGVDFPAALGESFGIIFGTTSPISPTVDAVNDFGFIGSLGPAASVYEYDFYAPGTAAVAASFQFPGFVLSTSTPVKGFAGFIPPSPASVNPCNLTSASSTKLDCLGSTAVGGAFQFIFNEGVFPSQLGPFTGSGFLAPDQKTPSSGYVPLENGRVIRVRP